MAMLPLGTAGKYGSARALVEQQAAIKAANGTDRLGRSQIMMLPPQFTHRVRVWPAVKNCARPMPTARGLVRHSGFAVANLTTSAQSIANNKFGRRVL
jgi:hypothetical protein